MEQHCMWTAIGYLVLETPIRSAAVTFRFLCGDKLIPLSDPILPALDVLSPFASSAAIWRSFWIYVVSKKKWWIFKTQSEMVRHGHHRLTLVLAYPSRHE
jgi:hypothetical protein